MDKHDEALDLTLRECGLGSAEAPMVIFARDANGRLFHASLGITIQALQTDDMEQLYKRYWIPAMEALKAISST